MLDDPERTSRLLAALEAALPFEVHLTPPLARLLREQQVVLPAGDRQTVSGVSYLGDEGGIVCHIVPPDGREVAFVSLTYVRVPPPMPLAAEGCRRRCRSRRRCSATRSTGSRSSGGKARAEGVARSGARLRLRRRTLPRAAGRRRSAASPGAS